MAKNSRTRQAEAKLSALYEQMKEGRTLPSAELQKQLVFELLDMKVAKLEQATERLKTIRNVLRVATLVFSGLATVALGLKHEWLSLSSAQNIALLLTASATFVGSLAALWDIDNYWLRNKVMLNRLRQLRYRLAFAITGATDGGREEVRAIFDDVIDAIGDEYWEKSLNRSGDARSESKSRDAAAGEENPPSKAAPA